MVFFWLCLIKKLGVLATLTLVQISKTAFTDRKVILLCLIKQIKIRASQLSKLLLQSPCGLWFFFFFVKEKLFTLLQFHIVQNGTKEVMQILQQKGQLSHRVRNQGGNREPCCPEFLFGWRHQSFVWNFSSEHLARIRAVEGCSP